MGQKSQGSGSTTPTMPGWLSGLLQGVGGGFSGMPGLDQLYNEYPALAINPTQFGDIASMQNLATSTNPYTKRGAKGLESFIGTPGTPSSATNAALKEFNDLQAPGILNQAASMGLGNSAAALDSLSQGQEQALVPFMQQDLSNSLNASQALGGLGQAQQGLQSQLLGQAYGMAGAPEQSWFNQAMGRENLGVGANEQIMQLLGNLFGNKQSQSSSGFDWSSLF